MLEKAVMLQGGHFCTPTVTLESNERIVILIGQLHVGLPAYYRRMQEFLDERDEENFINTHPRDGMPKEQPTRFCGIERVASAALQKFGVIEQAFGLQPRASWYFNLTEHDEDAVAEIRALTLYGDVVSCLSVTHIPGMVHLLEEDTFKIELIEWWPCLPEKLLKQCKAAC